MVYFILLTWIAVGTILGGFWTLLCGGGIWVWGIATLMSPAVAITFFVLFAGWQSCPSVSERQYWRTACWVVLASVSLPMFLYAAASVYGKEGQIGAFLLLIRYPSIALPPLFFFFARIRLHLLRKRYMRKRMHIART